MKHLFLAILLCCSVSILAKNEVPDKMKTAEEFYKKGHYEQAITIYNSILSKDEESAEIYYNLGNAYYKSGKNALAILYYERAILIKPNYNDARFNLELAQAKNMDKIEKTEAVFLENVFDRFANIMTSNGWAILSVIIFIVFLGLAFVYAFSGIRSLRKFTFFTAILCFFVSISSMVMSKIQKDKILDREFGIIMSGSVTVRSSPDDNGTSIFVVHEGTKVEIDNALDGWTEIKLSDGKVGWVENTDLEKI
jgi:hypothetical protein